MDLWQCSNYKDWLRQQAKLHRGSVKRWAQACGCQASYLSQVLHGNAHLTVDQAYVISTRLNLGSLETEFFQLLVDHARSHLKSYREHVETRINQLRAKRQSVTQHVGDSSRPPAELESLYFSTWYWSAIHMMASVNEGLTAESIAQRLLIPISLVIEVLERLEVWRLVGRTPEGRWTYQGPSIHLGPDSPYLIRHHDNWRRQAVDRAFLLNSHNLHYTALYALTPEVRSQIHHHLLELVERSRKLAGPAPSEEIVVMNIDWFAI
ncbi:MAG: DUF4423 domain-containing protein [Bdellovibrionales bacterium]|nr:DUF4423 domain-containing protein [Bdellovibrionales bacterium]